MATSDSLPQADLSGQIQNETTTEIDPTANMTEILKRVSAQQDVDRMKAQAGLVNVFNFAIQVQAGRVQWQLSDYRAFAIAVSALDSIGQTETDSEDVLTLYRRKP